MLNDASRCRAMKPTGFIASGESFSDYLHGHIWDPLYLDSFSFHLPEPLKTGFALSI